MGSKPLQSSKNGTTVLTLLYEPLRGETGLAASTPWLKFGVINTLVVRLSGELPSDQNQSNAPSVMDFNWLRPGEAKETHPIFQSCQNIFPVLN